MSDPHFMWNLVMGGLVMVGLPIAIGILLVRASEHFANLVVDKWKMHGVGLLIIVATLFLSVVGGVAWMMTAARPGGLMETHFPLDNKEQPEEIENGALGH